MDRSSRSTIISNTDVHRLARKRAHTQAPAHAREHMFCSMIPLTCRKNATQSTLASFGRIDSTRDNASGAKCASKSRVRLRHAVATQQLCQAQALEIHNILFYLFSARCENGVGGEKGDGSGLGAPPRTDVDRTSGIRYREFIISPHEWMAAYNGEIAIYTDQGRTVTWLLLSTPY